MKPQPPVTSSLTRGTLRAPGRRRARPSSAAARGVGALGGEHRVAAVAGPGARSSSVAARPSRARCRRCAEDLTAKSCQEHEPPPVRWRTPSSVALDQRHQPRGQVAGEGRGADLVVDHAELVALARPGRASSPRSCARRCRTATRCAPPGGPSLAALAGELRPPVARQRVRPGPTPRSRRSWCRRRRSRSRGRARWRRRRRPPRATAPAASPFSRIASSASLSASSTRV